MPRGAGIQRIDWGKQENTERLLAAILAAQGMKMDYQRVANMFGYGATYSTIEGQLRKCKRIAATLPDDNDDDDMKEENEEMNITDDEMKTEKEKEKKPLSKVSKVTHLSPGRVNKRSSRIPSSAGLSDETVVPKEMAGKNVVGGRVVKKEKSGTTSTGSRKKAKPKEEDEVKLIKVVKLE